MLESVAGRGGRYSVIGLEGVRKCSIPFDATNTDPFDALRDVLEMCPKFEFQPDCPFSGGWIGFLSYEAGRFVEPSAHWRGTARGIPIAHWTLYDTLLIHDRETGRWEARAVDVLDENAGRPPAQARCDALAQWCDELSEDRIARVMPDAPVTVAWNLDRQEHTARVRRIIEYLRAGDVFQVNLARQAVGRFAGHPSHLYRRLCKSNPADYAAYIPFGPGSAVVSSSPELFLDVRDGEVRTRPIKGTRPRTGTREADAAAISDLTHHAKDRAELNMIVDLLRNDLGRVCEYGTVRVEEIGAIEAHPTVYHRVATVAGRMRGDAGVIDLLRATFPGGSVTGAPKVRAMQIINELEPDPRGAYCGAIGFIGLDGSLQLNLAIRTMTVHDGEVTLAAGGGIVVDSDPDAEFDETEAKARGMIAALEREPRS